MWLVTRWLRVRRTAAIGFGFETQRLFTDRPDERLVLGGDDDDAVFGDGVTPAILFTVVADDGAARNQHVAVDDRAPDLGMASDANVRHQDRLFDVAEAVDP